MYEYSLLSFSHSLMYTVHVTMRVSVYEWKAILYRSVWTVGKRSLFVHCNFQCVLVHRAPVHSAPTIQTMYGTGVTSEFLPRHNW